MNRVRFFGWVLVSALFLANSLGVSQADDGPNIAFSRLEPSTHFFSGQRPMIQWNLTSAQPIDGNLLWRLSARRRTLAAGEQVVRCERNAPVRVRIPLQMPVVKSGVIEKLDLTIEVLSNDNRQSLAKTTWSIWVFPADPFALRQQWLKQLGLVLYDPMETMGQRLHESKIPFQAASNISSLAETDKGLVLVGEKIDLSQHPRLASTLDELAARGISVLWLAPEQGESDLTFFGQHRVRRPKRIVFDGSIDVIRRLDKRLDPSQSYRSDEEPSVRLRFTPRDSETILDFTAEDSGFDWLQLDYRDPSSRLVICGLRFCNTWEQSPLPRYLLLRLLEHMTDQDGTDCQGVSD